MRPVEAVQWADAFDVEVKDLPAVLTLEVSRVDGLPHEMAKLDRELVNAPQTRTSGPCGGRMSAWVRPSPG